MIVKQIEMYKLRFLDDLYLQNLQNGKLDKSQKF